MLLYFDELYLHIHFIHKISYRFRRYITIEINKIVATPNEHPNKIAITETIKGDIVTILKPSSNRSLFKLIISDQTLIKLK